MFCIDSDKFNTRKKFLGIVTFVLIALVMLIIYCFINNIESSQYNKLRILGLMGWCVMIVFFVAHKYITNVFLTPSTILLLSMFAFSYGQILLFGLGIEYDYFFSNRYYASFYNNDLRVLVLSNLYTFICLCAFCLGILVSIKPRIKNANKNDAIFNASMKKAFLILFFVSSIPYLAYNIYLTVYSSIYGYSQSLELTQPIIIRYVGVFFIPASIGVIISCEENRRLKRFAILCAIINCVCAFIIGGRSLAFGLIIGIVVVLMMNKRLSGKTILLLCIGFFVLATMSVSIADYRTSVDKSFISIVVDNLLQKNIFIQFLGEAGFSGTSIVWTMQLVRSGYGTFDGMTYVGAFVGLVPSSLDVFNVLQYFEQYTQLEGLLTEYYSFNFGVGFSLIAESYINFKWFGFIIIFFEAIILGKLLNLENTSNRWRRYVSIAMLTVLLTISRRDIVFLSNQFTLCIIFPYILIKVVKALSYKIRYVPTCKES